MLLTPSERISNYIKGNGIKQTFIAEKIGMKISTLNAKINGHVDFSPEEIEHVCWALGRKPNEFLCPRPPQQGE